MSYKLYTETPEQKAEIDAQKAAAFDRTIQNLQREYFGKRYVGASLSRLYASSGTQEKINVFMNKKRNFLVYLGNAGLGKTYFSAAMIEPALTMFKTFRYWKEGAMLKKIRASMDDYKGDYLDALKYMLDDELVFIDDVGSDGLTDWRKEIFFEAIDQRYNSTLPTIITSNFTREEFEELYHERVSSRLFDKDNIIIEIHDGPDHRKLCES